MSGFGSVISNLQKPFSVITLNAVSLVNGLQII
jgi:hypothetical protein